ncbi:PaaI family thioesterase [Methylobacterium sp. WSM2598]|uniref:PaaI family thioesterase n=1 Tax=Methylobacterium sp. WSM2598 TaxID=398261 RepID=UPI00036D81F5|nr:PaaI family thioesterase [Methylobacterium sp. WSM2598]
MPTEPVMSREAVIAYLDEVFPQIHHGGPGPVVESVGPLTASLRLPYHERHLRPGGTISGPAMMALADLALYAAILASLGPVALAVTTNLSFNFMRKPAPRDLIGEARLMKLGRQLAVGEVLIRSAGEPDLVCHATGTYAIPPRRN